MALRYGESFTLNETVDTAWNKWFLGITDGDRSTPTEESTISFSVKVKMDEERAKRWGCYRMALLS